MRRARLHLYLFTTELPDRAAQDLDRAHDIIDMEIGEHERVVQVDMVAQPVYRRATTNRPHAVEGFFTSASQELAPTTREVNVLDKTVRGYRVRVATIEEVDAVDAAGFEETVPPGTDIVVAEAIEVPPDGDSPESAA